MKLNPWVLFILFIIALGSPQLAVILFFLYLLIKTILGEGENNERNY